MSARAWLVVLAVACAAPRAEAARYSLEELVRKVSSEFAGVVAGREGVEAAQAQLRAAQLMWLPTGEATLLLSGSPKVRCIGKSYDPNDPMNNVPLEDVAAREANCLRTTYVDLRTSTGGLADIAPIHGLFLRLDVRLEQPLFTFGKIEASIGLGKAAVATARANLEREQADAVFNAMRAYWGLKAARAAVATIEEGVEKLNEWIERIDESLSGKNQSKYTESDLARLKVALANAQMLLLDQKRNRDYAKDALELLTGDPEADVDEAELDLMEADDPEALDVWQARALKLRPELKLADAATASARSVRWLRIAELLPDLHLSSTLNVGYAGGMDTPQNYFFNRTNFLNAQFGLLLRQPLDFGVRSARYLQARHEERAAVARARQSLINYSTEISKAYADYEEARGRAKETARGEKISRGWYNAVDQNLATGLFTDGREMVEAVQNYFTFRLRNFQAIFEANVALAWLRRTTGTPPQ